MATTPQKPIKTVTVNYNDPAPGDTQRIQILNDVAGNVGELQFKGRSGNFSATNNLAWDGNSQTLNVRGSMRLTGNLLANIQGNPSYLKIIGGNVGDVLSTDGAGNLSWQTMQDAGGYGNTEVAAYLPTFNGNLKASSANLGNTVFANYFIGDGSQLTGITASTGNITFANNTMTGTGNVVINFTPISSPAVSFTFTKTGDFVFPDGSIQTTAYVGPGDYNDLTNKPTIPTSTSDLTNGAGFITVAALANYATEDWVNSQGFGSGGISNRLVNGTSTLSLSANGTLNTPLLLPITFTAVLDTEHMVSPIALTGTSWEYTVQFQVSQDGTVQTMIDNVPWPSNPGYATGQEFEYTEEDHGIPGYTFTLVLTDVQNPGPMMYTANLGASEPPEYPSTIKSLGAIKLTSNDNSWVFGTNGSLTLPGTGLIKDSIGRGYINVNMFGDTQSIVSLGSLSVDEMITSTIEITPDYGIGLTSVRNVDIAAGYDSATLKYNNWINAEAVWVEVREQDAQIIAPGTRTWAGLPSYEAYPLLMDFIQNIPGGEIPPTSNMAPTALTAKSAYELWQAEQAAINVTITAKDQTWTFNNDGTLTVPDAITSPDRLTLNSVGVESDYTAAVLVDGNLGRVFVRTLGGIGATLQTWEFNKEGKLMLPAGGDIVDSAGNSVLGGGSSDRLVNGNKSLILASDGNVDVNGHIAIKKESDYLSTVGKTTTIGTTILNTKLFVDYNEVGITSTIDVENMPDETTTATIKVGSAVATMLSTDNDAGDPVTQYRGQLDVSYTGITLTLATPTTETNWVFDNNNLKLPAGGDIVDINGTSVLGGGASTGNISFIDTTMTASANLILMASDTTGDGYSVQQVVTDGVNELSKTSLDENGFSIYTEMMGTVDEWRFEGNTLQVTTNSTIRAFGANIATEAVDDTGTGGTASLRSLNSAGYSNIYSTFDATPTGANIKVYNGGSSGGTEYTWQFDNNGNLNVPFNGAIKVGNLKIYPSSGLTSSMVQEFGNLDIRTSTGVLTVGWASGQPNDGNTSAMVFSELGNIGNAIIRTGDTQNTTYNWVFGNDGNLTLPGNTFSVNYANGEQVSIGGGSTNTGNVTFNNQIVIGTGDSYGGGGLYLAEGPDSIANAQYLRVRAGDYPTHIHLDTGNNDAYDQYFGSDGKYLKLQAGGNISIGTDYTSNVWTFDSNYNLTVPGNIKSITTGFSFTSNISGINAGVTVVVDVADSTFGGPETGQVTISDVVGMIEANGTWYFQAVEANQIQLYYDEALQSPVDGTGWLAYVSGGLAVAAGYNDLSITGGNVSIVNNNGTALMFDNLGGLVFPGNNAGQFKIVPAQNTTVTSTAPTIIFTSSAYNVDTMKATIQVRDDTGISAGGTITYNTQLCEILVVKQRVYNDSTSSTSFTAEAMVYGVVHTSATPMATFDAQYNSVTNQIEITMVMDAAYTALNAKVMATESVNLAP